MESAIATAKSRKVPPPSVRVRRRPSRAPDWTAPFLGSRLGRTIIALNFLCLLILVSGALVLNLFLAINHRSDRYIAR